MPNRVTTKVDNWIAQKNYVERLMDDSAFTAAHPDDTLVLAGPSRYLPQGDGGAFLDTLLPLGMMVNLALNVGIPSSPVPSIGSGRVFGARGKAQITFSMGRLLCSGRNILRAVSTSAVRAGLAVDKFDDPAAATQASTYYINPDSELFYLPFGLYILVSNKARQVVGAFALENVHLTGYNMPVQAGQSMIMENLTGWGGAIVPLSVEQLAAGSPSRPTVTQVRDNVLGYGGEPSSPDIASS